MDNLHQEAGSRHVINPRQCPAFRLPALRPRLDPKNLNFSHLPLYCPCEGLIKPDIIFFGEEIPVAANKAAFKLAEACDLMLVIGTPATVVPANYLPYTAKNHGARIVEINPETTKLTRRLTDYYFDRLRQPSSQ